MTLKPRNSTLKGSLKIRRQLLHSAFYNIDRLREGILLKQTFAEKFRRKAGSVFMQTHKGFFNRGNKKEYSAASCTVQENSIIRGKRICFLGSSLTYGFAARGESFVDYLQAQDGIVAVKEAVSGTTMADIDSHSYISRLKKLDQDMEFDLFICQLSTNDSSFGIPIGEISDSMEKEDFDIETTVGAMEYIIAYVREIWNCPVSFFTCPRYPSVGYQNMVKQLYLLRGKWDFEIIDLWQDEKIAEAVCRNRDIYMTDEIHPTRACYQKLWTPFFRRRLKEILG